jgi:hypothetical protein
VDLLALSTGSAMFLIALVTIPIAALTFVLGAGKALDQVGKGQFAVEFDSDLGQKAPEPDAAADEALRQAEIRQLLEAKAYRQASRGETPVDVDAELGRLLEPPSGVAGEAHTGDAQLRAEVRQLVIARNERRARQGKEPLDVDLEVERQLRDLEGLGQ